MTGGLRAAGWAGSVAAGPLYQCALLVCTKVMTRPAARCLHSSVRRQAAAQVSGPDPSQPLITDRGHTEVTQRSHLRIEDGAEPRTWFLFLKAFYACRVHERVNFPCSDLRFLKRTTVLTINVEL